MKCRVVSASWNGHQKGKIVTVADDAAASLIRLGVVQQVKKKSKAPKE